MSYLLIACILALSVYILYPFYAGLLSWNVFLLGLLFILWFQAVKALLVRLTLKKISEVNSIPLTIITIYVFGATLFYLLLSVTYYFLGRVL